MARKKRNAAASAEDDVNLTPMLDVVFILLIFFIVTAVFIQEPDAEIDRISAKQFERQSPLGMLIAVDEQSKIFFGKSEVALSDIGFRIREARKDNPEGRIVVQPHRNAEAGVVIDLMEAINTEEKTNSVALSVLED
jgi:biopolymer transport protein ExbD